MEIAAIKASVREAIHDIEVGMAGLELRTESYSRDYEAALDAWNSSGGDKDYVNVVLAARAHACAVGELAASCKLLSYFRTLSEAGSP
jgi:hypothetical protein